MFGRGNRKTLYDYIETHEPYNQIDNLVRPSYLEGSVSLEHKNLETDVAEYWDLVHPLVADFINSYAMTYQKIAETMNRSNEEIENNRRQLTFEQQNVNDLTDEIRELKKTLQEEAVVRRDLEERLRDERDAIKARFDQEKRSLEIIANSKLPEGSSMDEVLRHVQQGIEDSAEVQRLKAKIDELETKIGQERDENEKIQTELSTSFMEKITRMDDMIANLKARLGEE